KSGLEDLTLALTSGQGAVRQLLLRRVPINHSNNVSLSAAAELALTQPKLMLALKYVGYFLGVWMVLRGLDRWLVAPRGAGIPEVGGRMQAGVLAVIFALLLVVVSEPFLLKAAPLSEFRLRLPVLVLAPDAAVSSHSEPTKSMPTSTILTIGIFAVLQVAVYLACL